MNCARKNTLNKYVEGVHYIIYNTILLGRSLCNTCTTNTRKTTLFKLCKGDQSIQLTKGIPILTTHQKEIDLNNSQKGDTHVNLLNSRKRNISIKLTKENILNSHREINLYNSQRGDQSIQLTKGRSIYTTHKREINLYKSQKGFYG